MIVDLHAHYPMHLNQTHEEAGQHDTPGDLVRGIAMAAMNALMNAPMVVTVENLRAGDVMIALSVLYMPFDEIDLSQEYAAPPLPRYYPDLKALLLAVEAEINARPAKDALIAKCQEDLRAAAAANQVALIHAVEGGFHMGAEEPLVRANVKDLAALGVAYITLAHLFFRKVATNAPAIPLLSDDLYNTFCPQPGGGVQPIGRVLIDEMVKQRILIDLTHMSRASITATFQILDEIDPGNTVPVFSTHAACALNTDDEYNITRDQIMAVQKRGGVIGLIACEHWMSLGRRKPRNFDESMGLLFEHIQKIRDETGTFDNIAIGSDMDGFIRPSLKGFDSPAVYRDVAARLASKFGQPAADAICYQNAGRVLKWWRS
jgi:microsomal dipeptidase-like Zn-dependent dipeptidase